MERKFTRVKQYEFNGTLNEFLNSFLPSQQDNQSIEGFVLRFSDGYLLKAKTEDYKRLHRLITGVSEKTVWEALKDGTLNALLENVPDEFYAFVTEVKEDLEEQHAKIKLEAMSNMKSFETRKDSALYFQTQKYPAVMFHLLDGKPIDELVWKMIKPKVTKVFKMVNEDSN